MGLKKIRRLFDSILTNPGYVGSYFIGRTFPGVFHKRMVKKAKAIGIDKRYLLFSFDCDTEKDIEVVLDVHHKLLQLGVKPTYAVPGELLIVGRDVYRKLSDAGAEFMNHGYRSHTTYIEQTKTYVSTVFYNALTQEEIVDDVIRGHEVCVNILGKSPKGFRTPHFGTFQSSKQLNYLYKLLFKLGYSYSSSTVPSVAMWHGPIKRVSERFVEFPVTGSYNSPATIIDSWNYRFSPTRMLTEDDYVDQFTKIINFFLKSQNVGILNIYADPSQVYDWPEFFECMALTKNFQQVSYAELADMVNN